MAGWMNSGDGEWHQRELDHQHDDVREFYTQLPRAAIVGVESCGYAVWFHRLVEETGHELRVGDARQIRQFAKRRQKNDRRGAAPLLELLGKGGFPAGPPPGGESREGGPRLRGGHRLARLRT